MPEFSVVIPNYNYGRYIGDTIQSVLDQDGVRLEVVVVDNCSTDDSVAVVRGFADRDQRVRLIARGEPVPQLENVSSAVGSALGSWVIMLCADDMLAPGALKRVSEYTAQEPDVVLVYGSAQVFADSDDLPPQEQADEKWHVWEGDAWLRQLCRRGRHIIWSPEAAVRTDVSRRLGDYRAEFPFTADLDYWIRASAWGRVARLAGPPQGYYRQHDSNLHSIDGRDRLDDLVERVRNYRVTATERPDARRAVRWGLRSLARESAWLAVLKSFEGDEVGSRRARQVAGETAPVLHYPLPAALLRVLPAARRSRRGRHIVDWVLGTHYRLDEAYRRLRIRYGRV